MNIKRGVCFNGVQPETIMGMLVVERIYSELGYIHCVTSICDGEHRPGSLHYAGLAFDVRTWADHNGTQLSDTDKRNLARRIKDILGANWDIVVESTHIHCELDRGKHEG